MASVVSVVVLGRILKDAADNDKYLTLEVSVTVTADVTVAYTIIIQAMIYQTCQATRLRALLRSAQMIRRPL